MRGFSHLLFLTVLLFTVFTVRGQQSAGCNAADFVLSYNSSTSEFSFQSLTGVTYPSEILSLDFGDGVTQTVWTAGFQGSNLYLASPTGTYLTSHTYAPGSCGVFTASLSFINKGMNSCNVPIIVVEKVIVVDGSQSGNIIESPGICGAYTFNADLTSLGITSPLWGFGDGGQSTSVSGAHTYQSNGTYVVTLQDAVSGGCAYFIEVVVSGLPESNFNWIESCTSNLVQFSGQASTSPTATYSWDFGDGSSIVTGLTPSHTYGIGGNYSVTFTVNDGNCSSTTTSYVLAGQPSPFFVANDLCIGTPFSPQNLPNWADSYSWNFGDGTANLQGYLISHDYVLSPGVDQQNFTITLTTVTGNCPAISYNQQITVSNPIDPSFSAVSSGCDPNEYTFTPASSSPATYVWDIPGSSLIINTLPTNVNHTFLSAGTKVVTLEIVNGECSSEQIQTFTIETPSVDIISSSDVVCGDGFVTLNAQFLNLDPQGNYTYSWNDGATVIGTSSVQQVSTSGTYTLVVTDVGCGNSYSASKQITFLPLPIASAIAQNQGVDCPGGSTGEILLDLPSSLQTMGYTVNGSANQTFPTYTLSGLSEGSVLYTIAYTNYPNCSYVGNATITYTGPTLDLTSTPSSCSGSTGTAVVNLVGSGSIASLEWTAVGTPQTVLSTNASYSGVSQGFYQVDVVTGTGCLLTDGVQVGGTSIIVSSEGGYVCNNGSLGQVNLSAVSSQSGETFTYSIISPQGQSGSISSTPSLPIGNYVIEVTGVQSGCSTQYGFSVEQASSMNLSLTSTPISCVGQGSVTATVYGGSGSYSYDWGLGINSPSLSNLSASNYSVTISDELTGCQITGSETLIAADPISISGVGVTGCEVSLSLSQQGTAPYIIEWTEQSSNSSTSTSSLDISSLLGGVYDVVITDALGCTDIYTNVTVGDNEASPKAFAFVFLNTDYQEPIVETKEYDELLAENMTEAADLLQEQLSSCVSSQAAITTVSYKKHCYSAETFSDRMSIGYHVNQEQYMLYYYDRAGSLTKTVPPEGVEFLAQTDIDAIKVYRISGNLADGPSANNWEPEHRLFTTYEYNALGQLKSQVTPDGGESRFIYDGLQRLRFSQSARQEAIGRFSYMKYDELGRIIESGESDASGLDFTNLFDPQNQILALNTQFPQTGTNQVTRSVFSQLTSVDYYGESQSYLQNRITYITRDEDGDFQTIEDQYKTFYSYDIHGNVKWLVQQDPVIGRNYIKYRYDLISGNVLEVSYNEHRKDKFFHRYFYDADNRLSSVETSRDAVIWDQDAEYDYYLHGPLRSVRIGEDSIQQIDFAYTLQGWLKSINNPSDVLAITEGSTTISQGNTTSSGTFLSDAFGMSLNYYQGDFVRTDAGNPYSALGTSHQSGGVNDLYNGNIRSWNWKTATGSATTSESMTMVYEYDKLQRIKSARSYTYDINSSVLTQNADNRFNTSYEFDRNGNLLSLSRNDHQGTQMDNINYTYQNTSNNQLESVLDASGSITNGENGDLISTHNYSYDLSGNLIEDAGQEYIYGSIWDVTLTIDWTVDGKVKQIHKTGGSTTDALQTMDEWVIFHYDAMGVRIGKTHIDDANNPTSTARHTRYVLDAQGNTMGVYEIKVVNAPNGSAFDYQAVLSLIERPIYGAKRLGTDTRPEELQTWEFTAGQAPMFTYNQNGMNVLSELTNWITPLLKTTQAGDATFCECDIQHTYFDYDATADDYTFTDEGMLVSYYGKTANGVAIGERIDGTLETYATIATNYLGDQTLPLVFNIENKLIKGTEILTPANENSKPILARVPNQQGVYHLVHLDQNQHPVLHTIDMTQTGWNALQPGVITDANIVLDDQFTYGAHMTLLEDHLNEKNLLYMTRYIPPSANCIGETELVVVEITTTSISQPIFLTRIESGDERGMGELQLSKNATELVYYNRLNSIAGFEQRMVELNIFGLNGDHSQITTRTVLVQPNDFAGTYGKASVDFNENGDSLMFSQNGVYEQNESNIGLQNGSEKQVMYFNRVLNTYEFGTPQGEYQYNEIRRGKDQLFYVPTEAESLSYAQWVNTTSSAPVMISATQGYVLYSSLPIQPHTISQGEAPIQYTRKIGYKHYELSDHLGNVRYVISDARVYLSITGTISDYELTTTDQQIAWSDYYPYGSYLTTRHVENESYRYGFQGQESDDEVKGKGNSVNYKYRMHDPRIGRFFAVDPLADSYPWNSPYAFSENNVVHAVELEGREKRVVIKEYHDFDNSYKTTYDGPLTNDMKGLTEQLVGKTNEGTLTVINKGPHRETTQSGVVQTSIFVSDYKFRYWKNNDDKTVSKRKGTFTGEIGRVNHLGPADIPLMIVTELVLIKSLTILKPVVKNIRSSAVVRNFEDLFSSAKEVSKSDKSVIKEMTGSATKTFDDMAEQMGGKIDEYENGTKVFTPTDGSGPISLRNSTGGDGRKTLSKSAKDANGVKIQKKIRFTDD